MFEGTPVRPSPLQLALTRESAFAAHAAVDSPVSPPAQPWGSSCPVHGATAGAAAPSSSAADMDCTCRLQAAAAAAAAAPGAAACGRAAAPEPAFSFVAPAAAASERAGCSTPDCLPGGGAAGGECWAGRQAPANSRTLCAPSSSGSLMPFAGGGHAAAKGPPPHTPGGCGGGVTPAGRPPISPTSSSAAVMDSGAGALGSLGAGRSHKAAAQGISTRFIRSMSTESDNQSLGFGARQALLTLRCALGVRWGGGKACVSYGARLHRHGLGCESQQRAPARWACIWRRCCFRQRCCFQWHRPGHFACAKCPGKPRCMRPLQGRARRGGGRRPAAAAAGAVQLGGQQRGRPRRPHRAQRPGAVGGRLGRWGAVLRCAVSLRGGGCALLGGGAAALSGRAAPQRGGCGVRD